MISSSLCYHVGPLLYCPAVNRSIVTSLATEKFGRQYSLALCLEDSINDHSVEDAEQILTHSLHEIYKLTGQQDFYLPKIFIRVREPQQIPRLYQTLDSARALLAGFIVPKITADSADAYIKEIKQINSTSAATVYMMPIIENTAVVDLRYRYDILYGLKDKFDQVKELILNVRVGGNDLCNVFGYRRQSSESIHDIRPVISILSDIVTVFGADYVVSGPVWEYYSGPGWDTGLTAELRQDRLLGFVGKTIIHPNQIPLVNQAYMVPRTDYEDAMAILGWDKSTAMVAGSVAKSRMNEYKTHWRWAERVVSLAGAYGVEE